MSSLDHSLPVPLTALVKGAPPLPPGSVLTGKLQMVWRAVAPKDNAFPQLTVQLRGVVFPESGPGSVDTDAYKLSTGSGIKYSVKLYFIPSMLPSARLDAADQADWLRRLQEEAKRLMQSMSKVVRVDMSGATFMGFEGEGLDKKVLFEAVGKRLFGPINGDGVMLDLDPAPPSKTPSWLNPTSPAPPSSTSHHPLPAQAPTLPPAAIHTTLSAVDILPTTRLRPISAMIPQFTAPLAPVLQAPTTSAGPPPRRRRWTSEDSAVIDEPASPAAENPERLVKRPRVAQGISEPAEPTRTSEPPRPAETRERMSLAQALESALDGESLPAELEGMTVAEMVRLLQQARVCGAGPASARSPSHAVKSPAIGSGGTGADQHQESDDVKCEGGVEALADSDAQQPGPSSRSPAAQLDPALLATNSRPVPATSPSPPTGRLSRRRQAEALARTHAEAQRAEAERSSLARRIGLDSLKEDLVVTPSLGLDRMPGHHPLTYTVISGMKAKARSHANVIGIVVDIKPGRKSNTGDCLANIIITDPSACGDQQYAEEDFVITVFRKVEAELPRFLPGTPFLGRRLKTRGFADEHFKLCCGGTEEISEFNNKPKGQLFSNDAGSNYATLEYGKLVYGEFTGGVPLNPTLGREEVERLAGLKRWWEHKHGESVTGGGNVASLGPRMATSNKKGLMDLKDVEPRMFCTTVFKILHVATNNRANPALELYITDGTRHSMRVRNFHNVDASLPPGSIFSLAIYNQPPEWEMSAFQAGKYMRLSNVRVKEYQGQLELNWSELLTDQQADAGWYTRRVIRVDVEDERARVIERRIRALKRGEDSSAIQMPAGDGPEPSHSRHASISSAAVSARPVLGVPAPLDSVVAAPAPPLPAPEALPAPIPPPRTIQTPVSGVLPSSALVGPLAQYCDPVNHRPTPLADIDMNRTVPNRFKVLARVEQIASVGKKGGGWVLRWCIHCSRSMLVDTWPMKGRHAESGSRVFNNLERRGLGLVAVISGYDVSRLCIPFETPHCQSCNDVALTSAELRYRFLILLSTIPFSPSAASTSLPMTLPVLISDADALSFLPSLPPLKSLSNPNDAKALQRRLEGIQKSVEDLLLGSRMDGERTRPGAEWCIESYIARPRAPKRKRGGNGGAGEEGEIEGVTMYRVFGMKAV